MMKEKNNACIHNIRIRKTERHCQNVEQLRFLNKEIFPRKQNKFEINHFTEIYNKGATL